MSQESNIQEIFGKFAVELADGAVLFNTRDEAVEAETAHLKGAEFRDEAAAFCANQGLEGKNAKSKSNILIAYFTWVAADRPERVEVEVSTDEVEVEVTTDEVVADDAADDVTF
jgi:hypothetical protein